ncbi:PPOX class F420-dependent oxidoreductase [Kitasatospora sp. NPDC088346]|uniref:PPOX class F420-dependent oxidoreductase n=1 Tax=Kitasatospora sp. NPDC088346 TaxID=3364073 RepID=UPI003805FA3F
MHAVRHRSDRLADARHLLLTTFDPDGTATAITTWVVQDGTALGVWAPADSDTVRRIRLHPGVLLTPCDAHGRPVAARTRARATLCDADTTARYRTALIDKYGLTAMLALARSRLRVGLDGTVGIRLTVTDLDRLGMGREWRPRGPYSLN